MWWRWGSYWRSHLDSTSRENFLGWRWCLLFEIPYCVVLRPPPGCPVFVLVSIIDVNNWCQLLVLVFVGLMVALLLWGAHLDSSVGENICGGTSWLRTRFASSVQWEIPFYGGAVGCGACVDSVLEFLSGGGATLWGARLVSSVGVTNCDGGTSCWRSRPDSSVWENIWLPIIFIVFFLFYPTTNAGVVYPVFLVSCLL